MTRIEILNRLEERSLGYRRLDDFMAPDFFKMPLEGDSGLCEFHDSRAKTDWGHNCKDFKPLKYDRLNSKREAQTEINQPE